MNRRGKNKEREANSTSDTQTQKRRRSSEDKVDVSFDRCAHVIRNPDLWVVERPLKEDGDAEDVWMNLQNGTVLLSSRALRQSFSGPVVCLKMAPSGCIENDICTFENDKMSFGHRDNSKGEVKLLFEMILQIQGSHSVQGTTRRGTTRRGSALSSTTNIGESVRKAIFQRHLGEAASARRSREDRFGDNSLNSKQLFIPRFPWNLGYSRRYIFGVMVSQLKLLTDGSMCSRGEIRARLLAVWLDPCLKSGSVTSATLAI